MLLRPKCGHRQPDRESTKFGSKKSNERHLQAKKTLGLKRISRSDLSGKFLLPRALRKKT